MQLEHLKSSSKTRLPVQLQDVQALQGQGLFFVVFVTNVFPTLVFCRLTETARLLRNVFSRSSTRMQGGAEAQTRK